MPPRNRFETEYKANFKPHEAEKALKRHLIPSERDDDGQGLLNKGEQKPVDVVHLRRKTQKAKENRALQYKAGLAPTMHVRDKLRYLSEYQKQFEWKRPLEREAPILSAVKMIYGGQDGNPSRASRLNLPKKTEYQLQFVRHPIVSSLPVPVEKEVDKGQDQLPEYNPLGHQDPQVAAGKPTQKSPLPVLPQKSSVFQSEYHANFKSPSKYEYVKGSWKGADPPHLHPPDEKSDNESKPLSIAWYQQVLELREKVRTYQSRARQGSHFISILRDLQNRENVRKEETSNENPSKNKSEVIEPSQGEQAHIDTPHFEPSRKSTPLNENAKSDENITKVAARPQHPKEIESQSRETVVPAIRPGGSTTVLPPSRAGGSTTVLPPSRAGVSTTVLPPPRAGGSKTMVIPGSRDSKTAVPAPGTHAGPVASGDEKLLWDKNLALPGPPLKKLHLLENVSHESTISDGSAVNTSGESIHGEQPPVRREAWSEEKPHRSLVVPPYHVSTSSASAAGSDSWSDAKISEMDQSNDDQHAAKPSLPVQATRKLFSGKRQEQADERGRQCTHSHGEVKPPHYGQAIPSATRKLFIGRRQEIGEDHGRQHANSRGDSSDDDRSSSSFNSQTSDALSVEAMDKRRALASETFQRAKRRQAQL